MCIQYITTHSPVMSRIIKGITEDSHTIWALCKSDTGYLPR